MKKLLLIAAIAVMAFGCKKDDDLNGDLVGTTWTMVYEKPDGYRLTSNIYFTTKKSISVNESEVFNGETEVRTSKGTYVYTPPTVKMFIEDGTREIAEIKGDKLIMDVPINGEQRIYTRRTPITY